MLSEPPPTRYDLHFAIAGFHVRVTPFFWLAATVFGWNIVDGSHELLADQSPSKLVLLVLWITCVFVSILIHELGHSLAMKRFGIRSHIVLWHFGGLAVPDGVSFLGYGKTTPQRQIVISAAGPAAQLFLAAMIIAAVRLSGYEPPNVIPFVKAEHLPWTPGERLSLPLHVTTFFILSPSVLWALLNLLPVYPLDGGQISRELFLMNSSRDGVRHSLILSVITAAGLVMYGLTRKPNPDIFLAMMFGVLGFSSFKMLQMYSGRGGYGGGGFGGGGRPW